MKIIPLAFDSFGVRSMATCVETPDVRITIDPGVALGPYRYGLPPHRLELQRESELWESVKAHANRSEVLVITHYHYDHHDPSYPELYDKKTVYIKHPRENINKSQQGRSSYFLEVLGKTPNKIETADGKEFAFGKTKIRFSQPVFHGISPKLGYVLETCVEYKREKFIHTSDVQGPSVEAQAAFILSEKPNFIIVDGPMTYMLGYRYPQKSVDSSVANLIKIMEETPAETIVMEHHFLRDLKYKERIAKVYEVAKEKKVKVITAAEFLGREQDMLEARRSELYKKFPGDKGEYTRFADV
jgi:hypothetical protein